MQVMENGDSLMINYGFLIYIFHCLLLKIDCIKYKFQKVGNLDRCTFEDMNCFLI